MGIAEGIVEKYETYISAGGTPIFLRPNVLKAMQEIAEIAFEAGYVKRTEEDFLKLLNGDKISSAFNSEELSNTKNKSIQQLFLTQTKPS